MYEINFIYFGSHKCRYKRHFAAFLSQFDFERDWKISCGSIWSSWYNFKILINLISSALILSKKIYTIRLIFQVFLFLFSATVFYVSARSPPLSSPNEQYKILRSDFDLDPAGSYKYG